MPVRIIKNILKKELQAFRDSFYERIPAYMLADVQKEMIDIAHNALNTALESCSDYESLDDYLSLAGYRMSLSEWIDSL